MRKIFLFLLIAGSIAAHAQKIDKKYIAALYARYPVTKSDFCTDCYVWINPYFQTLADVGLHQSLVTYGVYTKEEQRRSDSLQLNRKGQLAAWHTMPGFANESRVYAKANTTLTKPDEYAKGHFSSWELNAYSVDGVLLSDTYTFNAAIERQAQNTGTELGIENMTRLLVGHIPKGGRPGDLPIYDKVMYWKGAYGSLGSFTDGKTTVNHPSIYWNLLQYGNEIHAYWFPNDLNGRGQKNYPRFEIPVDADDKDKPGLIQRLGFDPRKIFHD